MNEPNPIKDALEKFLAFDFESVAYTDCGWEELMELRKDMEKALSLVQESEVMRQHIIDGEVCKSGPPLWSKETIPVLVIPLSAELLPTQQTPEEKD